MNVMRYEGINGEVCDFVPKKFKPLSYFDLLSLDKEKEKAFEIYALVDGGWLPPPFVVPQNLFVDSNVVINFERILKGNLTSNLQEMKQWRDLLKSQNLTINPVLYAFEGKQRKTPTQTEFKYLFEEASTTIKKILPNATVTTFNEESYSAVFETITNLSNRRKKESDFLIKIAPLIVSHNSYSKLSKIESDILNIAVSLKVELRSLVVLAALSCLYEPNTSNDGTNFPTARKILFKPGEKYSESVTYNTLADIHALEFFVSSLALSKTNSLPPFAFCTCDKPLALFGCGLNIRDAEYNANDEPNFNISIEECLFPTLNEQERRSLSEKLAK